MSHRDLDESKIIHLRGSLTVRTPRGDLVELDVSSSGGLIVKVQSGLAKSTNAVAKEKKLGRPSSPESIELRRIVTQDMAKGILQQPANYVNWLAENAGISRSNAGQRVRRIMRDAQLEHLALELSGTGS